MEPKQKVLLLGATGQTGSSIFNGLQESGTLDIEVLVRPASLHKPPVQEIQDQGIKIQSADLDNENDLVSAMSGIDILISAIGPHDLVQQKKLLQAAKKACIKRIVPCAFITIAPPHGVMALRDQKEEIYNDIKYLGIPYTIIDVGCWYQVAFPSLPSGKIDYAAFMPNNTIHGDGSTPNIFTDIRDIGRFVARIIDDERTLNKYVYTCGDVLSENEICSIAEEVSGERVVLESKSAQEIEVDLAEAKTAASQDPLDQMKHSLLYIAQYRHSMYVRQDNQPAYAKYLGYLDARELYPEFTPTSFWDYFKELLAGKAKKVYAS